MIALSTDLAPFRADIADVIRLFYPSETVSDGEEGIRIVHTSRCEGGVWTDSVSFLGGTREFRTTAAQGSELLVKRMRKRAAKKAVYYTLRDALDRPLPWGSLTGIRPTRLFREALESGMAEDEAERFMTDEYDVSPERAKLLRDISRMQEGLRDPALDEFDLYIGIPFCTTRCAYCSFSSGEIGDGRLVEPYVEALLREIRLCAALARERGLRVRAAYMGGGTPTSIPAQALRRILEAAQREFPGAREWTCEAGRPDTIDGEKLRVMRDAGVTRISVNPQTFNDETLRAIGRAHTGEDTVRAYEMARARGFDDVNMDVIAALPGEDLAMFARTLDKVLELAPESVTVHALAIKHSSRLNESLLLSGHRNAAYCTPQEAEAMISLARGRLVSSGRMPYYLYRQKYMAGNLENTGYAQPGKACLYNIGNMEETASVMALGAGAITKWLFPGRTLRIERAPNVRSIEEYIRRTDEMARRKYALIAGGDA